MRRSSNAPPLPPLTALERSRGVVLCLALVASAVVYSFQFTSFLHAKEAVLCACLALAGVLAAASGRITWEGFRALLPLWILLCADLLRLLVFPPPVPSDAVIEMIRRALTLTGTVLCFDLLRHVSWRRHFTDAIIVSALGVAVLGLVQYSGQTPRLFPVFEHYTQRVYSVFGNQDLFGGYLAVALPLLLRRYALSKRGGPWMLLGLGVLALAALISGSRSAWLAAAIGLAVGFPSRQRLSRRRLAALAGTGAFVLILGLGAASDSTVRRLRQTFSSRDEGRQTRMWLWESAKHMWTDAPLLGIGAGGYAYSSPLYLGQALKTTADGGAFDVKRPAGHPHSEPLRCLAQGGLLGMACWLWFGVTLLKRRGPEWSGLAAFAVFACFNGPSQSVAHTLPALILAAMLLAKAPRVSSPAWPAGMTVAVLCVLLAGLEWWAVLVPSYRLRAAQDAQLAGEPSLELYARTVSHPWPHARAWQDYGIALAEAGRDDEAYAAFLKAREGLDTGGLYLALAAVAERRGDAHAARRWALECLRRWPGDEEAGRLLLHLGGEPRGPARNP
ncbi:MAG: hypothetical protein GWP08_11975 [Nitrospiraceae bacterium]|nr:hypothetical protein [Nitrospiraceae bacterium]